jgi:hypothetical protein
MPTGFKGWKHGVTSNGYKNYGCRCVKCTAAAAAACARYRAKHYIPHPKPAHVHGTYNTSRCKHHLCVAKSRAYKLAWARSEKGKATVAAWRAANGIKIRTYRMKYSKTHCKTLADKTAQARYDASPKRKAATLRYRQSGKAAANQYRYKRRLTRADKLKIME